MPDVGDDGAAVTTADGGRPDGRGGGDSVPRDAVGGLPCLAAEAAADAAAADGRAAARRGGRRYFSGSRGGGGGSAALCCRVDGVAVGGTADAHVPGASAAAAVIDGAVAAAAAGGRAGT